MIWGASIYNAGGLSLWIEDFKLVFNENNCAIIIFILYTYVIDVRYCLYRTLGNQCYPTYGLETRNAFLNKVHCTWFHETDHFCVDLQLYVHMCMCVCVCTCLCEVSYYQVSIMPLVNPTL